MIFSVKITIPSDTRYLAPLRQMVAAMAKIVGRKRFPHRAERSCTLALIEAVDNAIFHAHPHRRHKLIDISLTVKDKAVMMTLNDKGGGLDHPVICNPNLTATRGRGLYLMRQLMGTVKSKRTKKGHALTLTYKF